MPHTQGIIAKNIIFNRRLLLTQQHVALNIIRSLEVVFETRCLACTNWPFFPPPVNGPPGPSSAITPQTSSCVKRMIQNHLPKAIKAVKSRINNNPSYLHANCTASEHCFQGTDSEMGSPWRQDAHGCLFYKVSMPLTVRV